MSRKWTHDVLFAAVAILAATGASETLAARYYVSAQNGSDAATGKAPEKANADGPWKSLARASEQAFRNGDELLLHCAEIHPGRLQLRVAEGEGQLRVGSFGSCPAGVLPRIDATQALQMGERGSLRRGKPDWEPTRVVVDKKLIARSFALYKVARSSDNPAALRLQPPLVESNNLAHAQTYARTRDWFVEAFRIGNGGGNPLGTGGPKTQYPLAAGTALAITGKEWVLSGAGWIFDASSGELIVAGLTGEVRVAPSLPQLQVRGAGSILIDGLQLEYAGQDAIDINIKGTAAVRGSTIVSPARRAINVQAAASLYAIDNQIRGSGEDAIFIGSAGRVSILRNLVQDTAVFEPMQPAVGAINVVRAGSALVAQNTIERSAYVGIRFGEGAEISSNLIVDSCLTLSDCAAIYTWQMRPTADRRPARIAGNLIVGVHGNEDVKLGFRVWAAGIYLDDFTSAMQVEGNVVFGARQGIYLHNAFQNKLARNITIGDRDVSMSVHIDSNDGQPISRGKLANTVNTAIMFPADKAETLSVVRRSRIDPFTDFNGTQLSGFDSTRAIAWFENTSDFEKPVYRREATLPLTSPDIARGIQRRDAKAIPNTGNWKVELTLDGFLVSTASRNFRLTVTPSTPTARCNEIAKLDAGPLQLFAKSTSVQDCGP